MGASFFSCDKSCKSISNGGYLPLGNFLIQSLAVLVIIPSVICTGLWNSTVALKNSKKYDAAIVRFAPSDPIDKFCLGAVLNTRYVLTTSNCFQLKNEAPDEIFVIVGYSHVGDFLSPIKLLILENGDRYKASAVHTIALLSLVRTSTPIKFNDKVRCVNLPKGSEFTFGVPYDVKFDSSNWCHGEKAETYFLYHKSGFSNCTRDEIFFIATWYIPICLTDKTPNCYWPRGAPLVFDKTVFGIKYYFGEKAPKPYSEFTGEIFINVVRYVNQINELMYNYEPCTE